METIAFSEKLKDNNVAPSAHKNRATGGYTINGEHGSKNSLSADQNGKI